MPSIKRLVCSLPMAATPSTPPPRRPKELDPLGAIIYYICVTQAKKSGKWLIPGHRKIERMLKNIDNKPIPQVEQLWNDLQWIIEMKLLFDESTQVDSRYHPLLHRGLSQHQVSERIDEFSPAFNPTEEHLRHDKKRYMDYREFVENKVTAVRLIAFKDLYHITDSRVPQKVLLEFFSVQGLIDADEFYGKGGFLSIMNRIRYIDFPGLRRGEEFSDRHRDDPLRVEPGIVFRAQDMYVELRALDYFFELKISDQVDSAWEDPNLKSRQAGRIKLLLSARKFIVEKHPTLLGPSPG